MKISEMNAHQKLIFRLMDDYTTDMIAGNENVLLDYPEDSEEYKTAKTYLSMGHEALKQDVYDAVMAQCRKGTNAEHARFAGKDFLLERIEKRLTKWGY